MKEWLKLGRKNINSSGCSACSSCGWYVFEEEEGVKIFLWAVVVVKVRMRGSSYLI